jgi:HK97 gp10 family phage protein
VPDRLTWNERELAAIARQDYLRRALASYGGQTAAAARGEAPRRTGAGANSIAAQTVLEDGEWTARVSWDRAHYYMQFQNSGTRYLPAQHFLEHALARFGRTAP